MNDTQRLDSLEEHGLCVAGVATLDKGEWTCRWVCHFGIDRSVEAESIREVIYLAVSSISTEAGNED